MAVLLLGACRGGTPLEVRTSLPPELLEEVEAAFEEEHPGVDLRFSPAESATSASELRRDPAAFDVWWGAPGDLLMAAEVDGLLQPVSPSWSEAARLPADADGAQWHPTETTVLVIAFDRRSIPIADAPRDWIDVLHYGWWEEVVALDPVSTAAGRALVGSIVVEALRDDDDLNGGFDWLARFHEQVVRYVDRPRTALATMESGDARVAILPRADAEIARTGDDPWLHYRIPESGTPLLIRGVAITASSSAPEAARLFVDFLGRSEVVTAVRLHTHWTPVVDGVDDDRIPPDFELDLPSEPWAPALDTLAVELEGWLRRWETDVRLR